MALPLFLITSGVRWVALSEGFYLEEFAKYRVSQVTALPNDELQRIAGAFIAYFDAEPQRLDVTLSSADGPHALFSEREVRHMEDVQALMHGVFRGWKLALVALVIGAASLIMVDRSAAPRSLAQAGALGGGITVLLVGAASLAALGDFRQLFTQFHLLAFTNDLWLLDPTRDRLIQLFPQGFFLDAAIRIGLATTALGAVVAATSVGALVALRTARYLK